MIDTSQLEAFVSRIESAHTQIKPKLAEVLDDAGEEFLDLVQDGIMKAGNVDTRTLLSSFSKGSGYGVYELDVGGLVLTVGTNVEYAEYVNDGHRQKVGRFIPGFWQGSHFIYNPGASTGMVLKASFVEGSHFFDNAKKEMESQFPRMISDAVETLLGSLF